MATIYSYEVEVKIRNKKTRHERLFIQSEHAYNVSDATYQASIRIGRLLIPDEMIESIERVSPPLAAIEASLIEINKVIEGNIRSLFNPDEKKK